MTIASRPFPVLLVLIAVLSGLAGSPAAASVRAAESGRSAAVPMATRGSGVQVQGDPSADSWLVTFKPDADVAQVRGARSVARQLGARIGARWNGAVLGFELHGGIGVARQLAARPGLATIESNDLLSVASTVQDPATWGLDRIDQRDLPLDGRFAATTDGAGVRAYVIDTGVTASHAEFGGRVRGSEGHTSVLDGRGTADCSGHGTHVAGTIAGATHGVAQRALVVPIRVLDCNGIGDEAGLVTALDHLARNARLPAVANLSIGAPASPAVDAAVRAVIDAGVTVVAAAGNAGDDACGYSPARVAEAITVAASTPNDARAVFSSHGPCVDVFAPGVDITSAWLTSDTATRVLDGTSMAAPHAAGVAALALSVDPGATPGQVASLVSSTATPGRVSGELASPDRLLYAGLTSSDLPDPPVDPLDGCDVFDHVFGGELAEGDAVYLPPTEDYVTTQRLLHRGCLDGPAGADFDLALVRLDESTGAYDVVATSETTSADEDITVDAGPGSYAWVVHAHAGSGPFQVGYSLDPVTDDGPGGPSCVLDETVGGDLMEGATRAATPTFTLHVDDVTRACLGGPEAADFDLLLQRRNPYGIWETVDATWSPSADEALEHTAYERGTYRWAVSSFYGDGEWDLSWRSTPTTTLRPVVTSIDGGVTASFSSTDDDATFGCAMDGRAWRLCTSPATFSGLADGQHTFRVRAVDAFGNVDPSPARRTFRVGVLAGDGLFVDVAADDIFATDIGRLAAAGITRGCNPPANDRFCPADDVTRGQMAAFLVRALGLPTAGVDRFADDDGSVFERDVQSLAAAGITRGCNPPANDRFCPADAVTRGQMAAFLTRALDL